MAGTNAVSEEKMASNMRLSAQMADNRRRDADRMNGHALAQQATAYRKLEAQIARLHPTHGIATTGSLFIYELGMLSKIHTMWTLEVSRTQQVLDVEQLDRADVVAQRHAFGDSDDGDDDDASDVSVVGVAGDAGEAGAAGSKKRKL
jgi:hypothetical protein